MSDGHSLEALTAADFRGAIGGQFLLTAGPSGNGPAAPVEVALVEVSEHASAASGNFRAPFSLLFHGPLAPVMPQAIYRLDNEQLGALELFIVPIGPEPAPVGQAPTAMRYEVVFG
jgi:hypothetical protein